MTKWFKYILKLHGKFTKLHISTNFNELLKIVIFDNFILLAF